MSEGIIIKHNSNGLGGTLTINTSAGVTVTATKDDKTKITIANSQGIAVIKGLTSGTWQVSIDDATHEPTTPIPVEIVLDYNVTITFFSATINITYPEGSTCIATDGVTTFIAPNRSGTWVLVVPRTGTWTITAGSISEKVEIVENGQTLAVTLLDKFYVFKEGTGAILPIKTFKEDSQCYVNVSSESISKGWQSNNRVTSFSTEDKIDLTDYYSLVIEYTCSDAGSGNYVEAFGISTVPAQGGTTSTVINTARRNLSSTSTKKTAILDLTKYTGEYYIGACGAGKTVIYNMWLVKPSILLFNGGTGDVEWTARSSKPTATIGETLYVYVNQTDQVSTITTTNKIDVSNYKILHFYVDAKTGEDNKRLIGLSNDTAPLAGYGSINSSAVAYIAFESVQTGDNVIDVSSISGSYYVCVVQAGSAANPRSMTVSKVWLE